MIISLFAIRLIGCCMMKHYLLYILIGLAVLPASGQGVTDYYRVNQNRQQYKRLLSRYGGPQIRDRWYVSLDGFVKTDRAQLDNSYDGLIENNAVGKASWGVTLGWSHREKWAIEGSYAQMPIHTQLAISQTNPPVKARFTSERNAIALRAKRLVLSTSKPWLRSGFWVSGGMWMLPGNTQSMDSFSASGYRYQSQWETHEPFRLTSQTTVQSQTAALAELGIEYNVRLSNAFDLGMSVRKIWGLTNIVTTDVTYAAVREIPQMAQLQGAGSGMSYGVTLRYSFSTQRIQTKLLNVQGKSRLGI